tara:strand:- start:744 stop:1541 length:798 start_codon:yes stop_codon:yes gene_type:complete
MVEGLLSEDQHQALVARLNGEEPVPVEEPTPEPEVEEAKEEEVSAPASEPEAESGAEPQEAAKEEEEEEEVKEGHRVPYDRFQQVNAKKRDLQRQLESRNAEFERLQKQLQESYQPPQRETSYGDADSNEEADPDSWGSRLNSHTSSIQDLQVKLATIELEKEVSHALEKFPNVPKEYLWESIANDGGADALNIASNYNDFVVEIEERAIARHFEESKTAASAQNPPTPPRPSTKSTVGSATTDIPKPQNMEEAREAMLRYLQGK